MNRDKFDGALCVARMRKALYGPRRTEKQVRAGCGRIATAYKHMDAAGDPAPVVSLFPGVERVSDDWKAPVVWHSGEMR